MTTDTEAKPESVKAMMEEIIDRKLAEKKTESEAQMEESIAKNVQHFPWVALGLGGGIAVVFTETVDGFMQPKAGATAQQIQTNAYLRGGIKIAGAIGALMVLKKVKYIGKDGAMITAALVGFDGIRDIIPFDTWIKNNIVAKITSLSPAGLTQGKAPGNPIPRMGAMDLTS